MDGFKSDNPYSTTRSSSLRLARRAGLRAPEDAIVARIKWEKGREASRRYEARRQRRERGGDKPENHDFASHRKSKTCTENCNSVQCVHRVMPRFQNGSI